MSLTSHFPDKEMESQVQEPPQSRSLQSGQVAALQLRHCDPRARALPTAPHCPRSSSSGGGLEFHHATQEGCCVQGDAKTLGGRDKTNQPGSLWLHGAKRLEDWRFPHGTADVWRSEFPPVSLYSCIKYPFLRHKVCIRLQRAHPIHYTGSWSKQKAWLECRKHF